MWGETVRLLRLSVGLLQKSSSNLSSGDYTHGSRPKQLLIPDVRLIDQATIIPTAYGQTRIQVQPWVKNFAPNGLSSLYTLASGAYIARHDA